MRSEAPWPDPVGRLAVLHPPGRMSAVHNPFGKDIANLQLWQAMARYGGYQRIDILTYEPVSAVDISQDLFGERASATRIESGLIHNSAAPAESGALLLGNPKLYDLAWMRRRRATDRAYSLVGLIHTVAPPEMRQWIAMTSVAPVHPWDALICTSPSVRANLQEMFAGWDEYLSERTGGAPPPHPSLPIIPLGVDGPAFAALADRPDARARARAAFVLSDSEVLVLWVGRLSYYEKAFPQAMFKAVQEASAKSATRVVFAMAGWFPGEADRAHYEQAALAYAPNVEVAFVDGNDKARLGEFWAGADIFLSLADNIQETFGITPLEAMASGLPVVVSDWDGYRANVRDGVEGFLVPTLLGPAGGGLGAGLVERHAIEAMSYQAYVGTVAQHTAVHIRRAAQALSDLIASPDLRQRMGAAGRERVRTTFDWPVIAKQIHALTDELAAVRAAARDPAVGARSDPVKSDPFRAFSGFASHALTLETWLVAAASVTIDDVRRSSAVGLDGAFAGLRAPPELCAEAFTFLTEHGGATVRQVLESVPTSQRRSLELGLAWMAKLGFVDWLGAEPKGASLDLPAALV